MTERCVCCGAVIPEERQVCPNCEIAGGPVNMPRQENDLETAAVSLPLPERLARAGKRFLRRITELFRIR